jgi:hypothetical protein
MSKVGNDSELYAEYMQQRMDNIEYEKYQQQIERTKYRQKFIQNTKTDLKELYSIKRQLEDTKFDAFLHPERYADKQEIMKKIDKVIEINELLINNLKKSYN